MGLKKEATELDEEIRKLRGEKEALIEENVALKTLEKDLEEEKERRAAKEKELSDREIDLEAARSEDERANLKVRVRGEEMEGVRAELLKKEKEVEGLKGELASVEELKKKVSSLEDEITGYKQEIVIMDQGCRATLKRLLKEQSDALYAGYAAKNDRLRKELDQYLKDREEIEVVEIKLFQAEEALKILGSLKTKHHVPIPDFAFADLKKTEAGLNEELKSMTLEDFTSENLMLGLPDDIGAYNVESIDFKAAILVGDGSGAVKKEEEEDDSVGKELRAAMETELTPQSAVGEGQEQEAEVVADNPATGTEQVHLGELQSKGGEASTSEALVDVEN